MGRETTTVHNWNYTLPNLLNHLDTILATESAKKRKAEILKKLNSSFFLFKNSSVPSATALMGSFTSKPPPLVPVHKPIFAFTAKTTMASIPEIIKSKINASEIQLLTGFAPNNVEDSFSNFEQGTSLSQLPSGSNDSLLDLDNTWWLYGNETWNGNWTNSNGTQHELASDVLGKVVTSVILAIIILTTIVGNVFVIGAILLERNLQQVANFLIVSLAVADLMVAIMVMPLGALYEISQEWALGPELCDMWTSSDVLCCTASILHLVAIALDRYWAVTYVDYIHTRNGKRIGTMILLVWMTALVVSIAPLFGWKDPDFIIRINEQKKCLVSQDLAYQIFATMATFYVPLTVILILYWKIFQTARKRIHKRPGRNEIAQQILKKANNNRVKQSLRKKTKSNGIPQQQTTAFTTDASGEALPSSERSSNNGAASVCSQTSDVSKVDILPSPCTPKIEPPKKVKKESLETRREKKAAKTLAIITGAFVICWLPFFVTALVMPICPSCRLSDLLFSIFLWLGYFNSTLNPIIYTIFSPEFRGAFKKILSGRKNQRYRPGKLN